MRLDSIFETEKGKNDYPAVKENLLKRFNVKSISDIPNLSICETLNIKNGYGTNTYFGKLKEGVEVSELELAMILDSGYSFFGGSSSIDRNGNFKVDIWFD